jgi:hypothetical protein
MAEHLTLARSCIFRVIASSFTPVTDVLESLIPANPADVQRSTVFDHFPQVFAIVDTSPILIV